MRKLARSQENWLVSAVMESWLVEMTAVMPRAKNLPAMVTMGLVDLGVLAAHL